MSLLERVSTLVRANLNDLIDKAEEPEKMIKQVILDMQNQLLQVKTQVAIAIADQHLLEKKQKENEEKVGEWMRKAEISVDKKQDDLARASLQRVESYRDGPEGAGGESEIGTAATGAEADRGAGQGRCADCAASPGPRGGQGQRRASGHGRWLEDGGFRPHEAQGGAFGGVGTGQGGNCRRQYGRPAGGAGERGSH